MPLGLSYLASACKAAGHKVVLIDAQTEDLDVQGVVDKVLAAKGDVLGITATTPIYHTAVQIGQAVRLKSAMPIIMGGVHATIMGSELFEGHPEIDYIFRGEGERGLPMLLDHIAGKREPDGIPGLVYRKDGEIISQAPDYIDDLDSLPFPDRGLLPEERYKRIVPGLGTVKYTDFYSSRGCPFKCTFCSVGIVSGKKMRWRSITNVIGEISDLVENHGVKHIAFMDENFFLNHKRVHEFADAVKEAKLKFTWEGMGLAAAVNREVMARMKESGLVRVSFGIESGNEEILKLVKKPATFDQIIEAYKIAAEFGIERRGSAIIGHPGETKKTAMDTINFLVDLKDCQQVYLNIATPYPGTELWDSAVNGKNGMRLLTDDFSRYQRYGEPVIEVNDLKAKDLVRLQRWGLLKFYMQPHRIFYNMKRAGAMAGINNAFAFATSIVRG